MLINNVILKLRRNLGITQKKLSEISGVSRPTIAEIESLGTTSTFAVINKLRIAFGLTWQELGKYLDEK